MNREIDDEFEQYLDGNSEISRLYELAKSSQPSDELSQRVMKAANASSESGEVIKLNRPGRHYFILPFAIAATILLSFSFFNHFMSDQVQDENQHLAFNSNVKPDTPELNSSNDSRKPDNTGQTGTNQLSTLESVDTTVDTTISLVQTDQVQPAQLALNDKAKPEASSVIDLDKEKNTDSVDENRSTKNDIAQPTVAQLEEKDTDETPAASKTLEENKTNLGNTLIATVKEDEEAFDNEDTDHSLSWMDRLPSNAPGKTQLTKQTSSTLTEKAWIKKIIRLHEANRHEEAAENIKNFRKLYPYAKLPEVLRKAYE